MTTTNETTAKYPCAVCRCEIGWDAPSGVCSEECLNRGQGFTPPVNEATVVEAERRAAAIDYHAKSA